MEKKSNLVAAVCITDKGKVLILKQSLNNEVLLTFPGGHLEKNETLLETVLRESKEEIGIVPKITGIVKFGFISEPNRDTFIIVFAGKMNKKDKLKIDNNEIVDYFWASKDDLKDKYNKAKWRHPFIKQIAISSLTKKAISIDYFKHFT